MQYKRCPKCGDVLAREYFCNISGKMIYPYCPSCRTRYRKEMRRRSKERNIEIQMEGSNPDSMLAARRKQVSSYLIREYNLFCAECGWAKDKDSLSLHGGHITRLLREFVAAPTQSNWDKVMTRINNLVPLCPNCNTLVSKDMLSIIGLDSMGRKKVAMPPIE